MPTLVIWVTLIDMKCNMSIINKKWVDYVNKEIVDNYISNIEDIVGKTKNVTIQATVKEIKKFEFEDTLVVILNLGITLILY